MDSNSDNGELKKLPDGRSCFWLHQEHIPQREKELVYIGFVPARGAILALYAGPKQLIEMEVLAVEGSNLFVRRVEGINHYLHVLQLVAVELRLLPPDLRNGLAAELSRALEKALTEEWSILKDHCSELMRILKLVREERKLEAPHVSKPKSLVRPVAGSANRCPTCGRDNFPPEQVPGGDGGKEY